MGGSGAAELALPPGKAWYLSPTFFLWRAGGYLLVWLIVIGLLNLVSRLRFTAGRYAGHAAQSARSHLCCWLPTTTFAAFDWAMSLEPNWYSSIYGAIVTAGGVLAAHALAICTLVADARRSPNRLNWTRRNP